jgi:PPK2 family polyphosphate:nucleotide phosphotransferase
MAKSRISKLVEPYIVRDGRDFQLKDFDPGDTGGLQIEKEQAGSVLQEGVTRLGDLQEKLYAQDRWGVLLVFQAMDAAGKDGVIKHVMTGINPQGCQVYSFKQPSSEDLDHDFLWRNLVCLPERGRIGIFNRSYYEEVLVVRVHPDLLSKQKLPSELVTQKIWKERYEDINAFERYLARNGYVIRKFFLHISKKEQGKRFEKRLDEPDKQWKFSLSDVTEREHWKE